MPFWPQTLVDYFQIASAIGTCGAVVVSLFLANRGIQTKLETSCRVVRGIGAPRLKVVYRNIGRDSVYLIGVGGTDSHGNDLLTRFIAQDGHVILPPGAPDTVLIEKHETVTQSAEGHPKQFVRIWLEDVSGKRFYVADSAESLSEIWSEMQQEPNRLVAGRDFPA
jgi:hypothetical protein